MPRNPPPPSPRPRVKRLPAEVRAGLAEDVKLLLAEGGDADDVARQLVRWYRRHLTLTAARRRVARAIATQRREQKAWPAVTDCDRLDAAFAALEAIGVLARQHYTHCGADGHSELRHETVAARQGGRTVRGYVFFHTGGTEGAVAGAGLHLGFGSAGGGNRGDRAVARRVVAALAAAGLNPEWDGDPDRCVFVPLVWQRRR